MSVKYGPVGWNRNKLIYDLVLLAAVFLYVLVYLHIAPSFADQTRPLSGAILRMPVSRYRVIGFLDDDKTKLGAQIHGVEVLGPIDEIEPICREYAVDEILIAIPSARRAPTVRHL